MGRRIGGPKIEKCMLAWPLLAMMLVRFHGRTDDSRLIVLETLGPGVRGNCPRGSLCWPFDH